MIAISGNPLPDYAKMANISTEMRAYISQQCLKSEVGGFPFTLLSHVRWRAEELSSEQRDVRVHCGV